jgi:hypothetical protein
MAAPQQFQLNLDSVAAKASEHVEVSLNAATLQFAARFLDAKDPDESKVKKLIAGIEGIYVRHFSFKTTGAWSQADLEPVRAQLHGPEWSKIVGVVSDEDGENAEIWLRTSGNKSIGVAIVATEAKEITVVNIAGTIDLEALSELGGHFGVPKVKTPDKPQKEE